MTRLEKLIILTCALILILVVTGAFYYHHQHIVVHRGPQKGCVYFYGKGGVRLLYKLCN